MFKYISKFFFSLSESTAVQSVASSIESAIESSPLESVASSPETTGTSINIDFNPMNFVNNLTYLAKGLIGIFIVIGIIMLITVILNKLPSGKNKKDD